VAVSIKRIKFIGLTCGAFAVLGFFLAPPQWPALGIAAICGILYGVICVWAREERNVAVVAYLPVFFGFLICRYAYFGKAATSVEIGYVCQFLGAALFIGCALITICLAKQNEKQKG